MSTYFIFDSNGNVSMYVSILETFVIEMCKSKALMQNLNCLMVIAIIYLSPFGRYQVLTTQCTRFEYLTLKIKIKDVADFDW